jgi:UDP-glucose 4-epimerase
MSIFGNDYPTPDGTCIRDYIHVTDLANAHLLALDHLRSGGSSRILNCGYGRGYSVTEVIDAVRNVAGTDFVVNQAPRRSGDPASVVASNEQLMRLSWKPALNDLTTIVRHALAWEKSRAIKA